jgi:hypothetical protein
MREFIVICMGTLADEVTPVYQIAVSLDDLIPVYARTDEHGPNEPVVLAVIQERLERVEATGRTEDGS